MLYTSHKRGLSLTQLLLSLALGTLIVFVVGNLMIALFKGDPKPLEVEQVQEEQGQEKPAK